jgi:hypothetical protein
MRIPSWIAVGKSARRHYTRREPLSQMTEGIAGCHSTASLGVVFLVAQGVAYTVVGFVVAVVVRVVFAVFFVFVIIIIIGDDVDANRVNLNNLDFGRALWAVENLAFFYFIFVDVDLDGTLRTPDHRRTSWPRVALDASRGII